MSLLLTGRSAAAPASYIFANVSCPDRRLGALAGGTPVA